MLQKGFKVLLAEAGASVESIAVNAALGLVKDDDVVFLDVREAQERGGGFIPGSVHAARGFLEFVVDCLDHSHAGRIFHSLQSFEQRFHCLMLRVSGTADKVKL